MGRTEIQAAGAVVLRGPKDAPEVLVVHRPAYDDWSLPKGKVNPDEYYAVTAVREVLEETGHTIRLIRPLSSAEYSVVGKPKTVHWWLAVLVNGKVAKHDDETDKVEWWPVHKAIAELSYPDDAAIVVEAMRVPLTKPLLIVRHAKAMNRKQWHGRDADRRLTERGRRQATALTELLAAFGVADLASSSSTRCMATFAPYAKATRQDVRKVAQLSEEAAANRPKQVLKVMAELRDQAAEASHPLAVCGHRPVLPAMFQVLGITPDRVMRPGEVALTYPDSSGNGPAVFYIPPTL